MAVAVAACGGDLPPLLSGDPPGLQAPPAVLYGVDFDGYRTGSHEVEVRAETAEVDLRTGVAELWDVRIHFDEGDRGPVDVEAQRAEVELASDDFVLSGAVEGSVGSRDRFYTSDLRYQRDAERLWTDGPARLVGARTVVRGRGLELDLRTRTLRLLGSVEAEIRTPEEAGGS